MRGPLELSHFENRFTELSQKQGSGAAVSEAWAFFAASAKQKRKGMEMKQREDKGCAQAMREQQQAAQKQREICDSSEGQARATWEQSAEEPRTPMARRERGWRLRRKGTGWRWQCGGGAWLRRRVRG